MTAVAAQYFSHNFDSMAAFDYCFRRFDLFRYIYCCVCFGGCFYFEFELLGVTNLNNNGDSCTQRLISSAFVLPFLGFLPGRVFSTIVHVLLIMCFP